MAPEKIKSATDQRPFVMVYHDFLESELLDNVYQKLVYIYLKKFADSNAQCFPSVKTLAKLTKISAGTVKKTLAELEKKGVIKKENRHRSDGGKTSNLYTLYDFKEVWGVDSSDNAAAVELEETRMIAALRAKGYTVLKEKELEAEPTKAQNQALKFNKFDIVNITTNLKESQQRYSLEEIKSLFGYDMMITDHPLLQTDIDSVMDILHTNLNTVKPSIRIDGEEKPALVVIGKLMRLESSEIIYAIEKYNEQTERIKNHTAYMLTLLYHAKEQMNLDIANRVQCDMANWKIGEQ